MYKCDNQKVDLSSEIALLKNYIELEKLRYDERLEVNFETKIGIDFQIPPLILLSLVENAFKHGAGVDSELPKISILIVQEGRNFTFEITNTVSKYYENKWIENIGLTNVRKQLDLIYGNNYEMKVNYALNLFTVTLNIN